MSSCSVFSNLILFIVLITKCVMTKILQVKIKES